MTDHTSSWTDRQVDALLAGHGESADADLQAVIAGIKQFTTATPPSPSPALQALFDGTAAVPDFSTSPAGPVPRRRPHRTKLRACVLGLTASLSLLTAGAAANALPQDAQRTAARVLNTLTPFHFPTPPTARRLPVSPVSTQPAVSPSVHASTGPVRDHRGADQGDRNDDGPNSPPASPEQHGTDTAGTGGASTSGGRTTVDGTSGGGGEDRSVGSQPGTATARGDGSDAGSKGSPTASRPTPTPSEGGDGSDAGSGPSPDGPAPTEAP